MIPTTSSSAEETEGIAALEAVKWAISLQISHVLFEGDAKNIINYITSSSSSTVGWRTKAHLEDVRTLLPLFISVMFMYVKRANNSVADVLATQARTSTSEVSSSVPPSFIYDVLTKDSVSIRAMSPVSI
ncbi:hypothetical protein BVC80_1769g56 [Macleaya cordata]|uniref:RNase H type-1 domain-containing protein n=1 Tax=Macleaya cordata TaxID=56857 RepID=A0A200QTK8_MACCD|nr:hypothetical protein BVC80_1769g56 [Macleaya cordata]